MEHGHQIKDRATNIWRLNEKGEPYVDVLYTQAAKGHQAPQIQWKDSMIEEYERMGQDEKIRDNLLEGLYIANLDEVSFATLGGRNGN